MDADTFKALFREKYLSLVDQGLAPDEAVARAMQELGQQQQQQTQTVMWAAIDTDRGAVSEHTQKPNADTNPGCETAAQASAISGDMDGVLESAGVEQDNDHGGNDEDVDMTERMSIVMETAPGTKDASNRAMPPPAPLVAASAAKPVTEPLGMQLKSALYTAAETNDYRVVKRLLYQTFSDVTTLNDAFTEPTEPVDAGDEWWGVDRDELQETYALLVDALGRSADQMALQNTWRNALETLVNQPWNICSMWTQPQQLHFVLILFDHPLLFDPDYVNVTGGLCKLIFHLSEQSKTLLREQWSTYFSNDELHRMLQLLQQAITVCLYGSKKLDLVYAACAMLKELHVINQTRQPQFADYEAFYNDAVNSEVDIVHDYSRSLFFLKKRHEAEGGDASSLVLHRMLSEMSFCDFPFVLDAASKSRVLQVDSDLEQRSRLQDAVMTRQVMSSSPYLVLRVRRENVIEDSLQQLVRASPETLKKPLKVKFVGEEGIDEGGVRKEFFQILIRQLLDPAYAMFTYDEDTRTMWFNSDSLEATMEFELIGILLGLAIYNSVILDVQFPHIVYKKLMKCELGLKDVETALPSLGKGLRQLLEFDGDVEEVFQRNFEYSYEIFGEVKTVELKPGGSGIAVTNKNREEYVSLYVEYILNSSVERQYNAFHKGFHLVCNGEVLNMFRWEELYLLICGSSELDFEALEEATHYEDGFTEDSDCIKYFWSVVHEMTLEEKKKLLVFSTGSDRVPIRGLSNLVFVISKNGSEDDRLPSAHTCFNHLLLPDYSTREKLKERLLMAITQAEGFGLR